MLLNVKAILVRKPPIKLDRQAEFDMPDMEVFMSVNPPNQLISVLKLMIINPHTRHLLINGQILQNQNRKK